MRFNWAKSFKEQPTCEDILKKVKKTEIKYWIFLILSVATALWGFDIIMNAPQNDMKQLAIGLTLTIAGLINIAVTKLWAHIILIMYFIIWDSKNRIEAEIRKSEAADL